MYRAYYNSQPYNNRHKLESNSRTRDLGFCLCWLPSGPTAHHVGGLARRYQYAAALIKLLRCSARRVDD